MRDLMRAVVDGDQLKLELVNGEGHMSFVAGSFFREREFDTEGSGFVAHPLGAARWGFYEASHEVLECLGATTAPKEKATKTANLASDPTRLAGEVVDGRTYLVARSFGSAHAGLFRRVRPTGDALEDALASLLVPDAYSVEVGDPNRVFDIAVDEDHWANGTWAVQRRVVLTDGEVTRKGASASVAGATWMVVAFYANNPWRHGSFSSPPLKGAEVILTADANRGEVAEAILTAKRAAS